MVRSNKIQTFHELSESQELYPSDRGERHFGKVVDGGLQLSTTKLVLSFHEHRRMPRQIDILSKRRQNSPTNHGPFLRPPRYARPVKQPVKKH